MTYDVVIVGGGLSGLTAAAYLSQAGLKVILCEKEEKVGGLVGSFDCRGFIFDAGARAIENSGVLIPMLKQLGIDLSFLNNPVSVGIENDIIPIENLQSLADYEVHLKRQFPNEKAAIEKLIQVIKKVMDYMDILYGIDNPLFMDLKHDKAYIKETLLPWLFKYILTVGKIKNFNDPIDEYLSNFIKDPVLTDMIDQHFFAKTPAFFALSYFSLYLDYRYPKGGTGALIDALQSYILSNGGEVKTKTSISEIQLAAHRAISEDGQVFQYSKLIWCADNKYLYQIAKNQGLTKKAMAMIERQKQHIQKYRGGDSVLTIYAASNLKPEFFSNLHTAHFFYTPIKKGISCNPISLIKDAQGKFLDDKDELFKWIEKYLALTTYETSIPCLRDKSLAPEGKTGLIISTLFDYDIMLHLRQLGLYDEAKKFIADTILNVLDNSIYPKFKSSIINAFLSTPLTIASKTGNSDGAITGWSFISGKVPAVSKMTKIAQAVKTPLPHVFQAGQWTYSPAGLPISMLTGKLAANSVIKNLNRRR